MLLEYDETAAPSPVNVATVVPLIRNQADVVERERATCVHSPVRAGTPESSQVVQPALVYKYHW